MIGQHLGGDELAHGVAHHALVLGQQRVHVHEVQRRKRAPPGPPLTSLVRPHRRHVSPGTRPGLRARPWSPSDVHVEPADLFVRVGHRAAAGGAHGLLGQPQRGPRQGGRPATTFPRFRLQLLGGSHLVDQAEGLRLGGGNVSPVRSSASARRSPTARGSSTEAGGAKTPSLISGWPKLARSEATHRSAPSTTSHPPPRAAPCTTATIGSGQRSKAANSRASASIMGARASPMCSPTSTPAEKARPSASRRTTRTAGVAAAASSASASPSIIAVVRTLSGGRSSVMRAIAPRSHAQAGPAHAAASRSSSNAPPRPPETHSVAKP